MMTKRRFVSSCGIAAAIAFGCCGIVGHSASTYVQRVVDNSIDATIQQVRAQTKAEIIATMRELLGRDNEVEIDDAGAVHRRYGAISSSPFGKWFVNLFTAATGYTFESQHVPSNTPTVVYTIPGTPAYGEQEAYAAIIDLRYDESDAAVPVDGSSGTTQTMRRFTSGAAYPTYFVNDANPKVSATSSSTQIDVGMDPSGWSPSGVLTDATAQIVWTGSALAVQVTCPVSCYASGWASGFHEKDVTDSGSGGEAVLSVSPSIVATVIGSGLPIAITTTAGAATGVTAATYDGVALTGCSAGSNSVVNCTLPSGTRSASTGNVTVSSPAAPTACTSGGAGGGCAAFQQAAVTAISPTSGPTTGSTAVTITLNAGATGGCSTVPTLDGVSCTGCSVVSDTNITCTSAAGSAGTGNVAVTSPSSPNPLVNGWSYATPATLTLVTSAIGSAAGGETVEFTGSGFVNGSTSFTIGGQTVTGVTCGSSTTCTGTTPANTSGNGGAHPAGANWLPVQVTVGAASPVTGSCVSHPLTCQYAYLPSTGLTADFLGDQVTTFSPFNLPTLSGVAGAVLQHNSGCSADPTEVSNIFGSGSQGLQFSSGSCATGDAGLSSGVGAVFMVMQYSSTSGAQFVLTNVAETSDYYEFSSHWYWNNNQSGYAPDLLCHVQWIDSNNSTGTWQGTDTYNFNSAGSANYYDQLLGTTNSPLGTSSFTGKMSAAIFYDVQLDAGVLDGAAPPASDVGSAIDTLYTFYCGATLSDGGVP